MIDLEKRLEAWVINAQGDSPLFSVLPAELRNQIFVLAIAPEWKEYNPRVSGGKDHDFHLRHDHVGDPDDDIREKLVEPGTDAGDGQFKDQNTHRYPLGTGGCLWLKPFLSPQLLATCRRIFEEAHLLIFEAERWYDDCGIEELPIGVHMPPRRLSPQHFKFNSSSSNGYGFHQTSPLGYWSRERADWERRFKSVRFSRKLYTYSKFLKRTPHPRQWSPSGFTKKFFQLSKVENLRISPSSPSEWDGSGLVPYDLLYKEWCPLLSNQDELEMNGANPLLDALAIGKAYHEMQLKQKQDQDAAAGMQDATGENAASALVHTKLGRPIWITANPEGLPCSYPVGSWAREFVNLPRIRTLTMDFHCEENEFIYFEAWIQVVIKTWRFPLNPKHHDGHHYLSAEGNEVRKMSWRGTVAHYHDPCIECNTQWGWGLQAPNWCEICMYRSRNVCKNLGPRMYTWTITWTRRTHEGPEVYPYNGAVEVLDDDYDQEGDSDMDTNDEASWEHSDGETPEPEEN